MQGKSHRVPKKRLPCSDSQGQPGGGLSGATAHSSRSMTTQVLGGLAQPMAQGWLTPSTNGWGTWLGPGHLQPRAGAGPPHSRVVV